MAMTVYEFLAIAQAARPEARGGVRRVRVLAVDLAFVRSSIAEGHGDTLLHLTDSGEHYFEAALVDGTKVQVELVSERARDLVRAHGAFSASDLMLSRADERRGAILIFRNDGSRVSVEDEVYEELSAAGVSQGWPYLH